ncbi:MAG: hypothetical protein HYX54_10475 [Chloroflexi bacterium]|nr:hypothetical protein [Chloroflexota bacterium]
MADDDRFGPHVEHDLEIVAAAVATDLADSERRLVEGLIAACPDCASLSADLLAIAVSTRALGSAFDGHAVPAPRDFRLSEADADRLSGRLPRLGRMTISRLWGRRLGGALAAIGLVGLLVSAAPLAFLGGAGSATSQRAAPDLNAATANPAMLAPAASDLESKVASPPEQDALAGQSSPSDPSGETAIPAIPAVPAILAVPATLSVPMILSGAALVAGLALLLATRGGRRARP